MGEAATRTEETDLQPALEIHLIKSDSDMTASSNLGSSFCKLGAHGKKLVPKGWIVIDGHERLHGLYRLVSSLRCRKI